MQKWKVILLVAAILVQSFYCLVMAREARFLETAAPVLDLSAKSAVVMEQEYTGADGEKHRPIMIHRVVYGSVERFIGILIEHFAGAFPTWLAPVQVKVLPISDKYADHGRNEARTCKRERRLGNS